MALTVAEGRDTFCVDELVPGRFATGTELVAQRCYHRLITPATTLLGGEEEADFGLDLAGLVGSNDPTRVGVMLPGMVRNELLKDPTVEAVDVVATNVTAGGQVRWTLDIKVTASSGTFDLLVAVTDVTVELLGVR